MDYTEFRDTTLPGVQFTAVWRNASMPQYGLVADDFPASVRRNLEAHPLTGLPFSEAGAADWKPQRRALFGFAGRSLRSSTVVAILVGLIVGVVAAVVWPFTVGHVWLVLAGVLVGLGVDALLHSRAERRRRGQWGMYRKLLAAHEGWFLPLTDNRETDNAPILNRVWDALRRRRVALDGLPDHAEGMDATEQRELAGSVLREYLVTLPHQRADEQQRETLLAIVQGDHEGIDGDADPAVREVRDQLQEVEARLARRQSRIYDWLGQLEDAVSGLERDVSAVVRRVKAAAYVQRHGVQS